MIIILLIILHRTVYPQRDQKVVKNRFQVNKNINNKNDVNILNVKILEQ